MSPASRLLVDIHTHVYLPRYAAFLRSRAAVPRIFTRTSPEGRQEERLLILDDEPSSGRPIGAQVLPPSRLPAFAADSVWYQCDAALTELAPSSIGIEMRSSSLWTCMGSTCLS